MDYAQTLKLALSGSKLLAHLEDPTNTKADDKFFFYLLEFGTIKARCFDWIDDPRFSWDLKESGIYSVQAHIKREGINIMVRSTPTLYLSDEDNERYNKWLLQNTNSSVSYPLNHTFTPDYPYEDFLVCFFPDFCESKLSLLQSFSSEQHLTLSVINESHGSFVTLRSNNISSCSSHSIFSGTCFVGEGELIFGETAIEQIDEIFKLDPVGNFALAKYDSDDKSYFIANDYFGIHKIFYLVDSSVYMVSTCYSKLICMASKLGLNLTICPKEASASLAFANIQPLHQAFASQMLVKPIHMMPVGKSIRLSATSLELIDSSISEALLNPPSYSEKAYRELLHKAKNDIINNTRAVLASTHFDNIICDLSGGLDSRTVFAAVTNLPEFKDKVYLNSCYSQSEPDDLQVAQEASSLYTFPYESFTRYVEPLPYAPLAADHWSYCLGIYYSFIPILLKRRLHRVARLNGFFGEITARPYYARLLFEAYDRFNSIDDFCSNYFKHHWHNAVITSRELIDELIMEFSSSLKLIPGRTPLEKFDLHYLFFRNGLHCSDRFRNSISGPEFGPLQSKSLFAAKMMTFNTFKNAKVQYDIINLLNPVLANIRYQSDFDNRQLEDVKNKFGVLGEKWQDFLKVPVISNSTSWDEAKGKANEEYIFNSNEERISLFREIRNFQSSHLSMALNFLRHLINYEVIDQSNAGAPIWLLLNKNKGNTYPSSTKWNIINRIASIYLQHRLAIAREKTSSSPA